MRVLPVVLLLALAACSPKPVEKPPVPTPKTVAGDFSRPLDARVASVSVIHDSAMLADAWATALTVLGVEVGMDLAARHGVAARFVEREGAGFIEAFSPALLGMIED